MGDIENMGQDQSIEKVAEERSDSDSDGDSLNGIQYDFPDTLIPKVHRVYLFEWEDTLFHNTV